MKKLVLILFLVISVQLFGQLEKHQPLDSRSQFDFSSLSWIDAYDSMHATLEVRYPYTQWKAIDWDSKNSKTRPLIIESQNANDTVLFVKELLEYLYNVPDGHISISGNLDKFRSRYINGSYGFNMIQLDDGSVVVSYIPQESPAYEAGIRTGDKILKWNGIHIDSVGYIELLNYPRNYSTTEGRIFSRYLMLSRDSVGAIATISYQNNNSKEESTITLVAFEDELELYLTGLLNTGKPLDFDSLVQYKIIENNIGYLFIGAESAEAETPEEMMQDPDFIKVKDAVTYFNENNVDKLIVDLRFNMGGNDLQAAVTMGLFYNQPSFYEYITASYDYDYHVIYELWTEPLTPLFDGEIAIIVDPNCISTGEGFAMMFQRLENATIVSHWGTNGSFGMVDYDPVLMPAGLQIMFPQAMSLNENHIIQLDSDSNLVGGLMPDIKVPNNVDNIKKQWEQGIDVQMEYAISNLLGVNYTYCKLAATIYPNPCKNAVNISLLSKLESSGIFNLFDINGNPVLQNYLESGSTKYIIELGNLSSGIYFYELKTDNKNMYRGKVVVSK
ncbi:MAG: T9SS type A sorting domain-containing protein [Bacteroidetes bacterium]|nr:T9SS type A sorting domain-containing protein [Bacteroidota bacterium]